MSPLLSPTDQDALLALARAAIAAHLAGEPPPRLPDGSAALAEPRGAFVTLHRGEELRGCIGHAVARLPLAAAVRQLAVSAATQDPRFPPLEAGELAELTIEVSALTALEPAVAERVEVGRHGLAIHHRGRAGLLLPQVATERGWDGETFLRATCRKAGLPDDAWRDPAARISWFTCEVFGE